MTGSWLGWEPGPQPLPRLPSTGPAQKALPELRRVDSSTIAAPDHSVETVNTRRWRIDLKAPPLRVSMGQEAEAFSIRTVFSCCNVTKFCLFLQKVSSLSFLFPAQSTTLIQTLIDTHFDYCCQRWDQNKIKRGSKCSPSKAPTKSI